MTYDDIPDDHDEKIFDGEELWLERGGSIADPLGQIERGGEDELESQYGMTLDQYMSNMITTPASAAATSGEISFPPHPPLVLHNLFPSSSSSGSS